MYRFLTKTTAADTTAVLQIAVGYVHFFPTCTTAVPDHRTIVVSLIRLVQCRELAKGATGDVLFGVILFGQTTAVGLASLFQSCSCNNAFTTT